MKIKAEDRLLAECENLKQALRNSQGQIKRLNSIIGQENEFYREVAGSVIAAEPIKKISWKKTDKTKNKIEPVLKFSDWHIGEVIKKDETEGFNAFNWDIAQEGALNITKDFVEWVNVNRSGYSIDNCTILLEGDFVSGDIHYELQVTNEFPLPVQTANAGLLLAECISLIAPHFERVRLVEIKSDNHGRLVKKPQAKQKTTNNMNHLVYAVMNARLMNHTNVEIIEASGSKHLQNINGNNFLIEHGDGIKGQLGIPFYGFQRAIGKESMRRMNTNKGFDYWSIGHWHVPSFLEWKTIVNGSLSGTSEFDHIQGRHADPSQVAFLVHPKHGVFNAIALKRKN